MLSTLVPSTSNAEEYAKFIADKAVLRKLIGTSSNIIEKGFGEDGSAGAGILPKGESTRSPSQGKIRTMP
jgi:replicative DNA helicase